MIVEFLREYYPRRPVAEKPLSCSVQCCVHNSYKFISFLLFGAAVNQSVVDIIKFSVGRLRPHFLEVCRPNVTASMCDSHIPGVFVYVNDYTCTMPEDDKLLESRYVAAVCPGTAWQSSVL